MQRERAITLEDSKSPSTTQESGSKSILIVEDDPVHRTLMEEILDQHGFRVTPAENGFIAMSKLESGQSFNLIIMDWDMPEMDGLEAARAIRSKQVECGWEHTPIFAFTGNREPGDKEKCFAAGMDGYLQKEIWLPRWRDSLQEFLEGWQSEPITVAEFDNMDEKAEPATSFDPNDIDVGVLDNAKTILQSLYVETIRDYLEDAGDHTQKIEHALLSDDSELVGYHSHQLKSASRAIGITGFSNISEAIEKIAKSGQNLNTAQPLVAQLLEAFQVVKARLEPETKST